MNTMANYDDDDVYFDAISTDGPPTSENCSTGQHIPTESTTTCKTANSTGMAEGATSDTNHGASVQTDKIGPHKRGLVAKMVNKLDHNLKEDISSENDCSSARTVAEMPGTCQGETSCVNTGSLNGDVLQQTGSPAFVVSDSVDRPGVYCFAKPFAEDLSSKNNFDSGISETPRTIPNVDKFGYSHPVKESDESETGQFVFDEPQSSPKSEINLGLSVNSDLNNLPAGTVVQIDSHGDNLYETVEPISGGFEVVYHSQVSGSSLDSQSTGSTSRSGCSKTGEKDMLRKLAEGINHEWKRKEAKKKSKALKRPSKSDKGGNPFTQHSPFDDPHDGAILEADDEEGVGHAFSPFKEHDDISCNSYFTDSSFDTASSDDIDDDDDDDDDFFPNRPLPPPPERHHQFKDLAQKIITGHHKKGSVDESPMLERVELRRPRKPPTLPESQGTMSQNQVKLRGVLQSLIDSEKSYVKSLERLRDAYRLHILSLTKKPEVKVIFQEVGEIISVHQMFEIELSDKMDKWNTEERIGAIFYVFSQRMVVNIYSDYVNNYEAACETIKELENSKQTFKDFLKRKQMESDDRLSLAGLMLKPIQRFPQFIMIIKDLLKYTPRDHHDREQLQEAVSWIENVAHQLNERKRQSEQFYHGSQIMSKLSARVHMEKNIFLIRQDDMEQHSHDKTSKIQIFLMNKRVMACDSPRRKSSRSHTDGVDRYTYKWHQSLQNLELNTSAVTPNMQTKINIGDVHSTITSPKTELFDEDPYNVASDLTDMMHDISVLAKIHQLASTLKCSYQSLSDDHIQSIMVKLQTEIQGKDYQLQMLNSNTIILQDKVRNKKYVFSASSAQVKQEWCIDFLLAKYSLDIVNIPSWHKADGSDSSQPALLMKHMSVDMQRTFTKITCGVKVYFPRKNDGSEEHLWICSSNEGVGQVSIVSLHTHKPSLIESFKATECEILCAENVPGFANVQNETAFEEDTVWMSTVDSVIQVFMLSEKQPDIHRRCIHTFNVGCMIISMRNIDDCVLCGNRSGTVIVFTRDDDGVWSEATRISLGIHPVTSIICVGDHAWAVCGSSVYIIDVDRLEIQGTVDNQLATKDGETKNFQYLVKAGVGVWASFIGQPNICLYHSESKRLLQDFNICSAINEFVKVYNGKDEKRNHHVTSLMVSLGMLWVGTNDGMILVYPLPRLRDGVPRINERPQVALHSHRGSVKFLIPLHYGPISGTPIRRRPSSVLQNFKVDESVIRKLPQVDKKGHGGSDQPTYLTLRGDSLNSECFYEDVKFHGFQGNQIYEEIKNDHTGIAEPSDVPEGGKTELEESGEHTYFVLEPQAKERGENISEVKTPSASTANVPSSAADHVGKLDRNKSLVRDLEKITRRPKPSNEEVKLKDKNRISDLKSLTLSLQECRMRPFPSNVQSELKNKLKTRKSMEDLTDREATQADVDILYPTLLRPRTLADVSQSDRDSVMSSSLPNDLPNVVNEQNYFRPRMSIAIRAKKPDMSASRRNLSIKNTQKESSSSPELEKKGLVAKEKRRSVGRSVSFNKGTDTTERPQKTRVGSSFSGGSSVDTLRKQDTNTILVLSGGDGYRDWKKRQGQSNYRLEEPCLMFWMYRF